MKLRWAGSLSNIARKSDGGRTQRKILAWVSELFLSPGHAEAWCPEERGICYHPPLCPLPSREGVYTP